MHDARVGFNDIKILPEPLSAAQESNWLLFVLLITAVALLVILLAKRSKKGFLSGPKPFEIAKSKLEKLEKERLQAKIDLRVYGERLSYILREFLENSLSIQALEMTTKELRENLASGLSKIAPMEKAESLRKEFLIQFELCAELAFSNAPEEKYSLSSQTLGDAGAQSLKLLRDINFLLASNEQPS